MPFIAKGRDRLVQTTRRISNYNLLPSLTHLTLTPANYNGSSKKRRTLKPLSALIYGAETPLFVRLVIISLYCTLLFYTVIIIFAEPFLPSDSCSSSSSSAPSPATSSSAQPVSYSNPDYDTSPCLWERRLELGYLCPIECELTRRLLMSVLLGAAIGWERRDSDR